MEWARWGANISKSPVSFGQRIFGRRPLRAGTNQPRPEDGAGLAGRAARAECHFRFGAFLAGGMISMEPVPLAASAAARLRLVSQVCRRVRRLLTVQ